MVPTAARPGLRSLVVIGDSRFGVMMSWWEARSPGASRQVPQGTASHLHCGTTGHWPTLSMATTQTGPGAALHSLLLQCLCLPGGGSLPTSLREIVQKMPGFCYRSLRVADEGCARPVTCPSAAAGSRPTPCGRDRGPVPGGAGAAVRCDSQVWPQPDQIPLQGGPLQDPSRRPEDRPGCGGILQYGLA